MKYEWEGHYRYKAGKYRVIYKLEEENLIVLVVEVGERKARQPESIYGRELPSTIQQSKINIDKRAQQTKYSSETESSSSESEGEKLKKVNGSLSSLNLEEPRINYLNYSRINESSLGEDDSLSLIEIVPMVIVLLVVSLVFLGRPNYHY